MIINDDDDDDDYTDNAQFMGCLKKIVQITCKLLSDYWYIR